MSLALKQLAGRILLAGNGEQAITLVQKEKIDIILLDMKMPGLSGLELLQEIRNVGYGESVIVMTAYDELELARQSFQFGADNYLIKPFDIWELKEIVSSSVLSKCLCVK